MSSVTGVRADIVAKYKKALADKSYRVKSEEIADKIAQKLKEEEVFLTSVSKKSRWSA